MRSVVIVGAGIIGTVLAVLLSKHGYAVEIVERHNDPRGLAARPGKSVNITLCTRGFGALEEIGAGDQIRALSVPVYGRVIHSRDGSLEFQPYGNRRECLYSISRHHLWLTLLDLAVSAGVPIRFAHQCTAVDFERGEVRLAVGSGGAEETTCQADLILAADGARSPIRHALLRRPGVQYSQRYADHANKELHLPADQASAAGLDPHALHIWPRGRFMLIAFPNLDGSLTCTLHMPLHGELSFGAIRDEAALGALFEAEFADVRPLMPTLARDYFSHPEIPMLTVRCSPLYAGRVALVGDAAHAMWPSYGQGANAGFEDCVVLSECLAEGDIERALSRYNQLRRPDADAIADLSEHHFEEIRDQVGDPRFHARKRIERRLNELYPDHYVPLYSRVSFSRMPYAEAVRIEHRQRALVDRLLEIVPPALGSPDGEGPDLDGPEARCTIHQFLELS